MSWDVLLVDALAVLAVAWIVVWFRLLEKR